MKEKFLIGFVCLTALLSLSLPAGAQDKPRTGEQLRVLTPVKIQVNLTEYDGEKKAAVLPYSFLMYSEKGYSVTYENFLRLGVRFPVAGLDRDGTAQYIDIGSNIDCGVTTDDDGRFSVRLRIERSLLYPPSKEGKDSLVVASPAAQPLVPTFRTQSLIVLRDGQTSEIISAADPLNGHVIHITVTLNVQK